MWGRVPEGWESAPVACRNPGRLTLSGADVGEAFCGGEQREEG